ncbi:MAG: peptidylprolyl isomerase [Acidiferrobacterales bacterium]
MSTPRIETNKVVSLTYSILDDMGEILEQSDLPISYVHGGKSELFEKLEAALAGKTIDDQISVTLNPDEGFGQHNPDLTFTDDLENVPEELRFVGAELEAQNADGESMKFLVSKIKDTELTVDANHPMAGKTVVFKVKVTDIRDASSDEARSGKVTSAGPGQGHPLQ